MWLYTLLQLITLFICICSLIILKIFLKICLVVVFFFSIRKTIFGFIDYFWILLLVSILLFSFTLTLYLLLSLSSLLFTLYNFWRWTPRSLIWKFSSFPVKLCKTRQFSSSTTFDEFLYCCCSLTISNSLQDSGQILLPHEALFSCHASPQPHI